MSLSIHAQMEKERTKDIELMEESGGKEETLPPGFRFHPTDEELITCYLINKISDSSFTGKAITDIDLNKSEPWELPGKAKMGEKEWYFFNMRDRKYPTGVRTNRATNTGYWKTTGKDREIFDSVTSELVGMKKTLVFYKGRAPRGEKSNWVMHEYRIHSKSTFRTNKDEWVICRIFKKSGSGKKYPCNSSSNNNTRAGLNPYSMHEIGPNNINLISMPPPPMMQYLHEDFPSAPRNFLYGRNQHNNNYINCSTTAPMMQYSQLNYPASSATVGEGFRISGLNLNLGSGGGGGATTTTQTTLRPMQHSPHFAHATMNSYVDADQNIINNIGVLETMSNSNNDSNGNRYMGMENCINGLDTYWPNSY